MQPLTLTSIFADSFRLVRERFGAHLLVYSAAMLPMILIGAFGMFVRSDEYAEILRWMTGNGPMPMPRPADPSQFYGLAVYPVMIVTFPVFTVVSTRLALDQLVGIERSVVAIVQTSLRPILWIMLMDTVLVVIGYIGCVCCLLPGVAIWVVVTLLLGVQSAVLCDRSVDWFEAARESQRLTAPHAWTMLGGAIAWFAILIAAGIIVWLVAAVIFVGVNGGTDLGGPNVVRAMGAAYVAALVLGWIPNAIVMNQWFTWHAVVYHRLTQAPAGRDVAQVFS